MGSHAIWWCALLIFFVISPAMAERVAHVIGVEGKVTVVREGNDLPVTRGERLYKSDQILTDRNSALELKMLEMSKLSRNNKFYKKSLLPYNFRRKKAMTKLIKLINHLNEKGG